MLKFQIQVDAYYFLKVALCLFVSIIPSIAIVAMEKSIDNSIENKPSKQQLPTAEASNLLSNDLSKTDTPDQQNIIPNGKNRDLPSSKEALSNEITAIGEVTQQAGNPENRAEIFIKKILDNQTMPFFDKQISLLKGFREAWSEQDPNLVTALVEACINNHPKVLKEIQSNPTASTSVIDKVSKGDRNECASFDNINCKRLIYHSLLSYAISLGNPFVIGALLAKGALLNDMVIREAHQKNDAKITAQLRKHFGDNFDQSKEKSKNNCQEEAAENIASPFIYALNEPENHSDSGAVESAGVPKDSVFFGKDMPSVDELFHSLGTLLIATFTRDIGKPAHHSDRGDMKSANIDLRSIRYDENAMLSSIMSNNPKSRVSPELLSACQTMVKYNKASDDRENQARCERIMKGILREDIKEIALHDNVNFIVEISHSPLSYAIALGNSLEIDALLAKGALLDNMTIREAHQKNDREITAQLRKHFGDNFDQAVRKYQAQHLLGT